MPELTITHSDGSTDTIPQTLGWTRNREVGSMRKVTATVDRADAKAANLVPKSDKVDLGTRDTVRLVDVEKGGASWRLVCYSMEWDANSVAPTTGGDLREGTDDTLISNLVSEVPTWTAGTINSYTGALSFILNHAHRHEGLRRIERNVPGELQFHSEGTVDYVDALGSDKTGSVTLSPQSGYLEGEIRVTNRGREFDGTHIRVIGAHEGEAQLYANLVPSSDPGSYENRVDYSTSRWSGSSDTDWDTWSNKDVTSQSAILEEASTIGSEIAEELVEVKATVSGVDLSVGDWVRVVKSDADLDRDMRVHRIKTKGSGAKVVDELLLSTRTVMRQGDSGRMEDVQRFNKAFQGNSVIAQGGGSRQPVDGTLNAFVPFRYPATEYEHLVEVEVRGMPYRAYSSGAASSGGSHSHSVTFPDHSHSFSIGSHTHDVSFSVPHHIHDITSFNATLTTTNSGHEHSYDKPTGTDGPTSADTSTETSSSGGAVSTTTDNGGGTTRTSSNTTPSHTHGPNPGITEFATREPSNCDVLINGTSVATNIGSGTFQATVDVTGEMNPGAWNEVEVSSDSLGHVIVTVYSELYKQIGSN